ncbi:class I SAM-dependent methyltransferase [bacterium]|nr:class I SAM-dependent methyltransferase [bacterium]
MTIKDTIRLLYHRHLKAWSIRRKGYRRYDKVNLCSGSILLSGYWNIDLFPGADFMADLEKSLLPFPDNSMSVVVCISSINYFSRERGSAIIKDVRRILKPGGIARFASQDLQLIARKYLERDRDFFFEKLPDGQDRYPGATFGDKFNAWFYGYQTSQGKHCRYFYDYESLEVLFREAGFKVVEQRVYMDSRLPDIEKIDNRPEQMFFLEAVK